LTSSGEVPRPLGGGDSGSSVLALERPDSGSSLVSLASGGSVLGGRDGTGVRMGAEAAGVGGGGFDDGREPATGEGEGTGVVREARGPETGEGEGIGVVIEGRTPVSDAKLGRPTGVGTFLLPFLRALRPKRPRRA
jgi:hypothetical protein